VARALVLCGTSPPGVLIGRLQDVHLGGLVGAAGRATTSGSSRPVRFFAAGAGSDYADRLRSAARRGSLVQAGETFSSVTTTRASTAAGSPAARTGRSTSRTRPQGGQSRWDNCVLACTTCNHAEGRPHAAAGRNATAQAAGPADVEPAIRGSRDCGSQAGRSSSARRTGTSNWRSNGQRWLPVPAAGALFSYTSVAPGRAASLQNWRTLFRRLALVLDASRMSQHAVLVPREASTTSRGKLLRLTE